MAEYRGLIAGLAAAAELGATDVAGRMDSKLVVEQMSGRWQIRHPDMRPLARRANELRRAFVTVTFDWIPRERNKHADRLANEAMDAAAGISRNRSAAALPGLGPGTADAAAAVAAAAAVGAEPAADLAADGAAGAAEPAADAGRSRRPVARAELARRVRNALPPEHSPSPSGQLTDDDFDLYLVESDPPLLRDAVEAMAALLPDGEAALAGLELGGIPLVTLLGQRTGRAIRFVRRSAKDDSTQRQIEGGPVDGLAVVLIEDVIAGGGAVADAVDAVRAAGGAVDTVVALVDRRRGGRSVLAARGVAVRAVFVGADLAP